MDAAKETQMCLPDWMQTPSDGLNPLQRRIRRQACAKRKRAREAFRAYQNALSLKERGTLWKK